MSELLNCPFCGKPPEHVRSSDHHGEFFTLGCPDVNCCAHWAYYTELQENEPAAIAAWNRRANVSAAGGAEPVVYNANGWKQKIQTGYIHQGCGACWQVHFNDTGLYALCPSCDERRPIDPTFPPIQRAHSSVAGMPDEPTEEMIEAACRVIAAREAEGKCSGDLGYVIQETDRTWPRMEREVTEIYKAMHSAYVRAIGVRDGKA